ncbi:hypothetical protein ACP70R_015199 [Stipagrostis hirtigluma subsp. patula]
MELWKQCCCFSCSSRGNNTGHEQVVSQATNAVVTSFG